jgi:endogenous inhibitor of DNA gyrase (YacG/DUF329 family)
MILNKPRLLSIRSENPHHRTSLIMAASPWPAQTSPSLLSKTHFPFCTQARPATRHCRIPRMAQYCPLQTALGHLQALNTQPQPQQNRLKNPGEYFCWPLGLHLSPLLSSSLFSFILILTNVSRRTCPTCKKKILATNLKRHLKDHTGENRVNCCFCGKSIGRKEYLQRHERERCPLRRMDRKKFEVE